MRLLIDTHILIWAGTKPSRLSASAISLTGDPANELMFSTISVAEVAIKQALGRPDFQIAPRQINVRFGGKRTLPPGRYFEEAKCCSKTSTTARMIPSSQIETQLSG